MCGFSAKGPWVVVVDGVPYGAYTENQANKIAGIIEDQHPDKEVTFFKMLKYDDAGEDYSFEVLSSLPIVLTHEMYQEAVVVDELAPYDRDYSGGGKLADLIVSTWERLRPRGGADNRAGHRA